MLNLTSVIGAAEHVCFQTVGDQQVLLDVRAGIYYRLNDLGARIWDGVIRHGHLARVWEEVSREASVAPTALEADFFQFLGQLLERGLIQVVDAV